MKNKKVLVTGAEGFIGSHLTELLSQQCAHVRALHLYNSFNDWGWLETIDTSGIEIISGDIRDPQSCREMVRDIDHIFHLAALIAIPYSYKAPLSYVHTNILGTVNLCQAALDEECEKIIHTSTSEVYGTALAVPISESHPLQPQSPYSASKIGADAMALSFFHSFNLPLVVARPFNTYGPRQSARAIIPTIISQIAEGKDVIQVGDLTPTRDLTYVKDTCAGLIHLANTSHILGQTINIGSNFEVSMGDLFAKIQNLMGSNCQFIQDPQRMRPKGSEVLRLWCDNQRLQSLTGFTPAYTLEEGLKETIEWFTLPDNLKRYKTGLYNV